LSLLANKSTKSIQKYKKADKSLSKKKKKTKKKYTKVMTKLVITRSAAKSFALAAGNRLERALRRTTKKTLILSAFPKGIKTERKPLAVIYADFDPNSIKQLRQHPESK
jgi:hypothetical protein